MKLIFVLFTLALLLQVLVAENCWKNAICSRILKGYKDSYYLTK